MGEQEERLREEGVPFLDWGIVNMAAARWNPSE
jgi:hypothetical protein